MRYNDFDPKNKNREEFLEHLDQFADFEETVNRLTDPVTADLPAQTFSYAHFLGIQTCIGTESPLTIPLSVKKRMGIGGSPESMDIENVYEGIFIRIKNPHLLDYYWLWTPEHWTWNGNTCAESTATLQDFSCALNALKNTNAPFQLALCGWVLGPQEDRCAFDRSLPSHIPFSCINRQVGNEFIDSNFKEIKKHPTWAIPWLEDDHGLISMQLWVGRMRKDAYDAHRFGCTGLIGIHWRTRIISPNIQALMEAAWKQNWSDSEKKDSRYFSSNDLYASFVRSEFGKDIPPKAAFLFSRLDCHLPRPSHWENGPGLIFSNSIPWKDVKKDYTFVDEFDTLEPFIKGKGAHRRYHYWKNEFHAMKESAHLGCLYGEWQNTLLSSDSKAIFFLYKQILHTMENLCHYLVLCIDSTHTRHSHPFSQPDIRSLCQNVSVSR